jgi:hypothetical protein
MRKVKCKPPPRIWVQRSRYGISEWTWCVARLNRSDLEYRLVRRKAKGAECKK